MAATTSIGEKRKGERESPQRKKAASEGGTEEDYRPIIGLLRKNYIMPFSVGALPRLQEQIHEVAFRLYLKNKADHRGRKEIVPTSPIGMDKLVKEIEEKRRRLDPFWGTELCPHLVADAPEPRGNEYFDMARSTLKLLLLKNQYKSLDLCRFYACFERFFWEYLNLHGFVAANKCLLPSDSWFQDLIDQYKKTNQGKHCFNELEGLAKEHFLAMASNWEDDEDDEGDDEGDDEDDEGDEDDE